MKRQLVIGVLALQGDFSKHIDMLKKLDVEAIEVRRPEELLPCDGLLIPGGESTAIIRQMQFIGLTPALRTFAKKKPIFGTCAGLILMSKEIVSDPMTPLGFLDIEVERNAFGRQVESFIVEIDVCLAKGKKTPFQAVFIRAPRIRSCSKDTEVLASFEGEPILIRQGHHIAATFHPELTSDTSIHQYFLDLVRDL